MTGASSLISDAQILALTVTCPNGVSTDHCVEDGASLIIGNGHNCGLKLAGDEVSPIHCVIRFNDGKVAVQDWCSKSGTFVDGNQISDEVTVSPGCELRVGGYLLSTALSDARSFKLAKRHGGGSKASAPPSQQTEAKVSPPGEPRRIAGPTPHTGPAQDTGPAQQTRDDEPAPSPVENHKLIEAKPRLDTESKPAKSDLVKAKFEISDDPRRKRNDTTNDDAQPDPEGEPDPDVEAAPSATEEPRSAPQPKKNSATSSAENRRRAVALTPEQSFDQETIELLQSEVEILQSELADRDARIQEMTALVEQSIDPEPLIDSAETEALVARLEDLLDELARSDHRIRALEELLLAAQESSRAGLDEREQVERWLGDIEQRISARESEWQAERDVLSRRIDDLRGALADADRQLEEATTGSSRESAHEASLQRLREQNDELNKQLAAGQEQQRRMEQRLSEFETKSAEEQHDEKLEAAVRAERLKLAQERAAISRERADLMRQMTESQQHSAQSNAVTADERFNAFRQTLREIHAQEGRQPVVAKTSLGSRIADLWKRLDGPTDTD